MFISPDTLSVRLPHTSVQGPGFFAFSISFNGYDWTTGLNKYLTFYDAPVVLDKSYETYTDTFMTQFGTSKNTLTAENKTETFNTFIQLASCNKGDTTGINCFLYNRSMLVPSNIVYRLSPGVCDPLNADSCCSNGHDVPLTLVEDRGFCEGIVKMKGTTPSLLAGNYHTCISFHNSQFLPIKINYFLGGTGPSGCDTPPLTVPESVKTVFFTVYNVNIQTMQPSQVCNFVYTSPVILTSMLTDPG